MMEIRESTFELDKIASIRQIPTEEHHISYLSRLSLMEMNEAKLIAKKFNDNYTKKHARLINELL